MIPRITIEGLDELIADVNEAALECEKDMGAASLAAADYGVRVMQESHPYTDRTYNLSGGMHTEPVNGPNGAPEAEIVVPATYAKYVDEGTSRNRPYPFTPLGAHAAGEALEQEAEKALDAFGNKISR